MTITKEFISETYYCSSYVEMIRKWLDKLEVKYITENVFSGFNGTKVSVVRPRGKGSRAKTDAILKILE